MTDAEIKRMKDEAAANAAADEAEKQRIDKLNHADTVVFQTKKQLEEFGTAIPADKKAAIEDAVKELEEAHKAQNIAAIDPAIEKIQKLFGEVQQDILNAQQAQAGAQQQQAGPQPGAGNSAPHDDHVTDVDFEEVK